MSIKIKDKVTLVTGANRGIGSAIVESFVKHGAKKVYAAVRDVQKATALVEKFGSVIVPVSVDLSKPETIKELAKIANDVDIVVNNAGVLESAEPLSENVETAFNYELTINVFGLLRMANAFIPVLEKNGGGAFVQLNSVASIKNFTPFTTYSASKAAAYSITQGLRDTTPKNISILSVHPGPILTDMAKDAGMEEMGSPVESVSEGIVTTLQAGNFHLFPDAMAKDFEAAYKSYSDSFIEAEEE